MRRAALAAACAIALLGAVASASAANRPAVRLLSERPAVVQGSGFRPQERVVVEVTTDHVWKRVVIAGAAGRFTVRFAGWIGRCEAYSVRATGSNGSRAWLRSGPALACEPEPR